VGGRIPSDPFAKAWYIAAPVPMPSYAPPPRSPDARPSLVARFGSAVGMAAAAALVCVLPAALRVSADLAGVSGTQTIRVWLALAAVTLGPMLAAILVLRGAKEGFRAFLGPRALLRAFGVGLWLLSLFVALTLLGSFLRATTHHHALAGVTYAFGALFLAVGLGLVSARVVAILGGLSPAAQSIFVGALSGFAAVALAAMSMRFMHAASHDAASSSAASAVVDRIAFVIAALLGSRRVFVAQRALVLAGPPIALFVAAVGFSILSDAALRDIIGERAPAFAPLVNLVSGR